MALNSIVPYYDNNIKEIEENQSLPPPRVSSSWQYKTISINNNYNRNLLYNKYHLNINALKRKAKSFSSYFNIYRLYDNFFNENIMKKDESRNKKYYKKTIKAKNAKISKSISTRKKDNFLFTSREQHENNSNLNTRINNKRIIKKIGITSGKMNLCRIPKLRLEEDYDDDEDKPRIRINESLSLRRIFTERENINTNLTTTEFYNINTSNNESINSNNLLIKLKKVPYIRKKVKNLKKVKLENIKSSNNISISQSLSSKNFSIRSEKSIEKGKLIPKKIIKKPKKLFDISLFNKIKKNDGILYILRFLDYYDLINIFETKNKKLLLLINKYISKLYYTKIKKELSQFNSIFELIKFSIVPSKFKESLTIDIIANIRIKMNPEKNGILDPLYIKLAYSYNYFKKIKFNKELITKEDYESESKLNSQNLCDYYSFDFYPYNINKSNKNNINNKIYISKELPIQGKDCNNIATVQPVLSFLENDQGILNFEIYNAEKGFVNYNKINISIKMYNLKNYLKQLTKRGINNIRVSDYEELCTYWKNIDIYEYKDLILKMMKNYFGNFFLIQTIFYDNIGIFIFKVHLKAIKSGYIKNKKGVGINIKILEKNEIIKNEIRKNNLLFEKRDVVEIRVGDEIIYYFCLK